jgi:hypothetical protein
MGRSTTKKTAKKKSPHVTELSRPKKELQRVTEQLESQGRELAEALAQQTATSEILRMIAGSGTSLQSMRNSIPENAAKLCESSRSHWFSATRNWVGQEQSRTKRKKG